MKLTFRILLFAWTVLVLFTQCEKNQSLIIPDQNFLNALIESGVDTDGDGEICHCEAEAVIYLDVSNDSISDMRGIEKFINIEWLKCNGNQLSTLDITNNHAL